MSRSLYARLYRRYRGDVPRPTRRQVLAGAAAGAAGLLLSGCSTGGRTGGDSARRVAIVGGGLAGLSCAHELRSAGHDVRVYEARPMVGGRVRTLGDLVPGRTVEAGGEFIGANHPLWVTHARRFRLDLLDVTESEGLEFPVFLNGRRLGPDESEALYLELERATNLLNAPARRVRADRPWLSAGAADLDRQSVAGHIDTLDLPDSTRQALKLLIAIDNGQPAERQSLLAMLAMIRGGGVEAYWTDSEAYRCAGGNQRLAERLAQAIGAERVRPATPVKSIDLTGPRAVVTTAGGETWEADEVVLAVAPTAWKHISFNPALPEMLKPAMGDVVKYLFATRDRFWQRQGLAPDAFTDGLVGLTWDATDNQGDGPACLTCFSSGDAARQAGTGTEAERSRLYRQAAGEIYPELASQVTGERFIHWPGYPTIGAGYSFPAAGQVTTLGPMLHQGLGKLHFAGEHTDYAFVGYMEGALQSGARVARAIHRGR